MIIDEKVIMPAVPPYFPRTPGSSSASDLTQPQFYSQALLSPAPSSYGSTLTLPLVTQAKATLASLPPHILLQVIHHTFPYSKPQLPAYQADDSDTDYSYVRGYIVNDSIAERQRRTLLWLSASLRLVGRTLYTACMHVLRSTYLPAYLALVRAPYTSDPFPMGSSSQAPGSGAGQSSAPPAYGSPANNRTPHHTTAESPLASPQRETAVLDRFISLKIRHDVLMDESSLHLDRDDAFRDLFEVAQPRARLEDLVREIGMRRGVVFLPGWSLDEYGRKGLGGAGNGSTSSLHLLRDVDAQIARAHAQKEVQSAPSHAQASRQPPAKKASFFSFKKSTAPSHSSYGPASSSSTPQSTIASSGMPSTTSSSKTSASYDHYSHPPPFSTSTEKLPLQSSPSPPRSPAPTYAPAIEPLPFPAIAVSFQPRRIGLVLARTRTIVDVPRASGRRESLETLATALIDALVRELGG